MFETSFVGTRALFRFLCLGVSVSFTRSLRKMTETVDKCFCGVVVVERIYVNVSYCSFVAPGNNSLEVYERVE